MRSDDEEEVFGKAGGELEPLVGEAPPVDVAPRGSRRRCITGGGVEAPPSIDSLIGVENLDPDTGYITFSTSDLVFVDF